MNRRSGNWVGARARDPSHVGAFAPPYRSFRRAKGFPGSNAEALVNQREMVSATATATQTGLLVGTMAPAASAFPNSIQPMFPWTAVFRGEVAKINHCLAGFRTPGLPRLTLAERFVDRLKDIRWLSAARARQDARAARRDPPRRPQCQDNPDRHQS